MSRRPKRHRSGFTLVEALAAGMILALAGGVLARSTSLAMRSLTKAKEHQRAAELLDRVLTKIDLIGPSRLELEGPTEGDFRPPNDAYRWQAVITPRTSGYLYDVEVRISWPGMDGQSRWVDAQTRLNDPPNSRPANLNWGDL